MKFLNKKEQVIDLEITPYGKHLLSKGLFRPEFYAFYDDETIYDSRYGGFSEVQNSASVRINEAVQLETQANFSSIEEVTRQITSQISTLGGGLPRTLVSVISDVEPEKDFSNRPLGRSSVSNPKLPGWNIKALRGTIANSVQHYSGSENVYNIPQLNFDDITCTLELSNDVDSRAESFYLFQSNNRLNDKVLNFIPDSIVIEVDEQNTDFDWKNFDLEVYEVEEETRINSDGSTRRQEILKPLYFENDSSLIENGILLDEPKSNQRYVPIDSTYSEYYFNVSVDNDISEEELCDLRPEDKPLGVFSRRQLECEDLQQQQTENFESLYDTEEFEGECE